MSLLAIYIILSYIYTILAFAHEIYHHNGDFLNFKKHDDIRYIFLVIFVFILSPITAPISLGVLINDKFSAYLKS